MAKKDNFMWEHLSKNHPLEVDKSPQECFDMSVTRVDRDPFRRIIREAVKERRIMDKETGTEWTPPKGTSRPPNKIKLKTSLMNTRAEFHLTKLVDIHFSQN